MDHWEAENADSLGMALKEAGFQTSQLCCSRPSCFDFAAKKDNETILIKIRSDVDGFSCFDSRELRVIAGRVSAAPLLVSDKAHDKPLEDDTVYSRYSICVVTGKTLLGVAFQSGLPLVNASPGGYFVEVDGPVIEKRRKEMGLSIGKLAGMIGVSRRTLYGYERCMAKASVSSAYNLAKVLGIPVARPVNVFEKASKQRVCLLLKAKHAITCHTLLRKVLRKFASFDFSVIQKAPFDFVLNIPDENYVIVGGIVKEDENAFDTRAEEILSFSNVVNAHPMLITERRENFRNDVPCISAHELNMMHSPKDLVSCI